MKSFRYLLSFSTISNLVVEQVKEVLHYHHYAICTEEAYVKWILTIIRFNDHKHPRDMGRIEMMLFYRI